MGSLKGVGTPKPKTIEYMGQRHKVQTEKKIHWLQRAVKKGSLTYNLHASLQNFNTGHTT